MAVENSSLENPLNSGNDFISEIKKGYLLREFPEIIKIFYNTFTAIAITI